MTALQLEALAQQVAERVEAGHRIEDSFIEAKAVWLADHQKAARRIAAHANEMRGQPIVWIIGVDEDAGKVPGAAKEEQGDWFAQVCRFFDQEAPTLALSRVTYHGDLPIVALLFDTSTFPYVVTKGSRPGVFEREVPMREGARTRSAKRSEIVRMFSATQQPVSVHIRRCHVSADINPFYFEGGEIYQWRFDLMVFASNSDGDKIFFPKHYTRFGIITPEGCEEPDFASLASFETYPGTTTTERSGGDLIVHHAGSFRMRGSAVSGSPPPQPGKRIALLCEIGYIGVPEPLEFRFDFEAGRWSTRSLDDSESAGSTVIWEPPPHISFDQSKPKVEIVRWTHPPFRIIE